MEKRTMHHQPMNESYRGKDIQFQDFHDILTFWGYQVMAWYGKSACSPIRIRLNVCWSVIVFNDSFHHLQRFHVGSRD